MCFHTQFVMSLWVERHKRDWRSYTFHREEITWITAILGTRFAVILNRDLHTKSLKDSCLGNCHPQVCNTREGIVCLSFPAGKMAVIEPTSFQACGWTVLCTFAPNAGALSYHGSCNGSKKQPQVALGFHHLIPPLSVQASHVKIRKEEKKKE